MLVTVSLGLMQPTYGKEFECTSGWTVVAFAFPSERDNIGIEDEVLVDGKNRRLNRWFLESIKKEGIWGKTLTNDFIKWFDDSGWHASRNPLDDSGTHTLLGAVVVNVSELIGKDEVYIEELSYLHKSPWFSVVHTQSVQSKFVYLYIGAGIRQLEVADKIQGGEIEVCIAITTEVRAAPQ